MIVLANSEAAAGIGAAAARLSEGGPGLDAIEAGIRLIEADPSVRSVGLGGWPNLLGEVELDACVMDGTTLRTGAVGALRGFRHPVSIARQVMEQLPHVLLVGDGAARFAREIGADPADNLTADSRRAWDAWFAATLGPEEKRNWPDVPLAALCRDAIDPRAGGDTTVFLALDRAGDIAVATSTSGWGWKYPGRLSDSPIVGAGCYADTRYGACACTGTGEMAIRAGTARAVVLYLKMGLSLSDALHEAAEDMRRLQGGLISGVAMHAIDAKGNYRVVSVNGLPEYTYWVWTDAMAEPIRRGVDDIVRTAPRPPASPVQRFMVPPE
jgi:L-asparaginase